MTNQNSTGKVSKLIVVGMIVIIFIAACNPTTIATETVQENQPTTSVSPTAVKPSEAPTATTIVELKPIATPAFRDTGDQYTEEQSNLINSGDTIALKAVIKNWNDIWAKSGSYPSESAYVQMEYVFGEGIAVPVLKIFDASNQYLLTVVPPKEDYVRDVPQVLSGEDEPLQIAALDGQTLAVKSVSVEKNPNYFVKGYIFQRIDKLTGKVAQEVDPKTGQWVDVKVKVVKDEWNIVPGGISANEKYLLNGDIKVENQDLLNQLYSELMKALVERSINWAKNTSTNNMLSANNVISFEELIQKAMSGQEIFFDVPILAEGAWDPYWVKSARLKARGDTILLKFETKENLNDEGIDPKQKESGFIDFNYAGVGGDRGSQLVKFEVINNNDKNYLAIIFTSIRDAPFPYPFSRCLYVGADNQWEADFANLSVKLLVPVIGATTEFSTLGGKHTYLSNGWGVSVTGSERIDLFTTNLIFSPSPQKQ